MNEYNVEEGFNVRLTMLSGKKIEFRTYDNNIMSFVKDFDKQPYSYYQMTETQFVRKDQVAFIEEVNEKEPSELEKHVTKLIDTKDAEESNEREEEEDTPLMAQMKRELETMKAKEEALKRRSR